MNVLKIVLISVLGAMAVGGIGGFFIGKSINKHKNPDYKPVLSKKEGILTLLSVVVGIVLVLSGVLFSNQIVGLFPNNQVDETMTDGMEEGTEEGAEAVPNVEGGGGNTVTVTHRDVVVAY